MKKIEKKLFGKTESGEPVYNYRLENRSGTILEISNYGATVVSLLVRDKSGNPVDVVLGFDSLDSYLRPENPYFGCIIGRFGNRIEKGKFKLKGKEYNLATNDVPNHIHGGIKGFNRVVWEVDPFQSEEGPALRMKYISDDGEEGYPGKLSVEATHILTEDNALKILTEAETDAPTILNITHHSYFNLDGPASESINDHTLTLNADYYTPIDATAIPTGEIAAVSDTPLDFRNPHRIGNQIDATCPQLQLAGGYDHNWIINKESESYVKGAELKSANSGIVMEVWTTLPGIQFYTGNSLDGTLNGKNQVNYGKRKALCLEPQFYPDAPNKPEFPTCELHPGEKYSHLITYKFL